MDNEPYRLTKLQKFENIFITLIQRLIQHFTWTSDLFLAFNTTDLKDDLFDDYIFNMRDLGKVLRDLIRLLGVAKIAPLLQNELNTALQVAQVDQKNTLAWVNIHGILTSFESVSRVIEVDEIVHLRECLNIIFSLPYDQYLAFRYITIEIITNLSYIIKNKTVKEGQQEKGYLVEETKLFIKYLVEGLKNPMTELESSKCI